MKAKTTVLLISFLLVLLAVRQITARQTGDGLMQDVILPPQRLTTDRIVNIQPAIPRLSNVLVTNDTRDNVQKCLRWNLPISSVLHGHILPKTSVSSKKAF